MSKKTVLFPPSAEFPSKSADLNYRGPWWIAQSRSVEMLIIGKYQVGRGAGPWEVSPVKENEFAGTLTLSDVVATLRQARGNS